MMANCNSSDGGAAAAFKRLSHPQMRIFLDQLRFPESPFANISWTATFESNPSSARLKAALNAVLRRQDALRLRFAVDEGGMPVQYVAEFFKHDFEVLEFPSMDAPSYLEWADANAQRKFDLIDSEMFSLAIILFKNGVIGIFAKFHHLVYDGFSVDVFIGGIERFLLDTEGGGVPSASPTEACYFDLLDFEDKYGASSDSEKHRQRWLDIFTPLPEADPIFAASDGDTNVGTDRRNGWAGSDGDFRGSLS
ncbi:condensation domain-containing protein [Desulfonatronum parangueonense]